MNLSVELQACGRYTISGVGTMYVFDGIPRLDPRCLYGQRVVIDYEEETIRGVVLSVELKGRHPYEGKPFVLKIRDDAKKGALSDPDKTRKYFLD